MRARNEGAAAFDHSTARGATGKRRRPRRTRAAPSTCATVSLPTTSPGPCRFTSSKPDPEFLSKLAGHVAAPVPAGAPAETGTAALPGTGPYRVRRFTPSREVVLERNPFFREWSPAAQPAGRPDRIVFSVGANSDDAAADVLRGAADVVLGSAVAGGPGAAAHRAPRAAALPHGAQPGLGCRSTRAPRRSTTSASAARSTWPSTATPPSTSSAGREPRARPARCCRPGPPATCATAPTPADPTASGRWQGPDLARAGDSSPARATAACSSPTGRSTSGRSTQLAHVTLRALRQLGYRTRLRFLHGNHPPPLAATGCRRRRRRTSYDVPAAAAVPRAVSLLPRLATAHAG